MKSKKLHLPRIIYWLFKGLSPLTALAFLLILIPVTAHAVEPVTVAWDENNPVPGGYVLYWGTSSRDYAVSHDVGGATQYTVPDLREGTTYYFAATAYDDTGNESAYSKEIVHTVGVSNNSPATPSVPSGPSSGYLQTNYSFSSTSSDQEDDDATLQYRYDWDGVISGWGASSQRHAWSSTGNFCVKAQAKDSHDATSAWSNCRYINIAENTHPIIASAGAHGSITPSGSVMVNDGDNQTFTFTPAQDYEVLDVVVDGASIGTATFHTFNNVRGDHTIAASFVYVPSQPVDSDGDGVPDHQDAFPDDSDETIDTDGDGLGNNADNDDDGDGMPDAWEIVNHLDPLVNDAAGDPDGDGITNFKEYQEGTGPYTYEDLSEPEAPVILTPFDDEVVSLAPPLTVDSFYDPDIDDFHAESQWQIFRADDNFCVLDVTSPISLTSLEVPRLILEEDTDYTWRMRFVNNRDAESDWSDFGTFTTDFANNDSDGNGIPDYQEVAVDLDLDNDGTPDRDQTDIKCVNSDAEDVQIGISIKDSENVASIASMEIEDATVAGTVPKSKGKPATIQFGLINFKIMVNAPGDETVVALHLSRSALDKGKLYKYDSINDEWFDYSDYAEFSPNRKVVYLTLKDGGFGDADGIENGIIVDPLTVGTDTDSPVAEADGSGSSESEFEEFIDRMLSNVSCFISTAADQPDGKSNIWSEVRGRELATWFILILFAYIGSQFVGRNKVHNLR